MEILGRKHSREEKLAYVRLAMTQSLSGYKKKKHFKKIYYIYLDRYKALWTDMQSRTSNSLSEDYAIETIRSFWAR